MLRAMLFRVCCIVLALIATSCIQRRPDQRHPASCADTRQRALPVAPDAEVAAASSRAKHIVRARVHFTGTVRGDDGTSYDYIIVAPLQFLRGSPEGTHARHREEFPLLMPAGTSTLAKMMCREGDIFLFLVDIPAPGRGAQRVPGDVAAVFGPDAVTLHGVLGDHERGRIVP